MRPQFFAIPSLPHQVARHIKEEILARRLVSGDRLKEQPLSKELGVSRGTVREACIRLEVEGIIRKAPRVGYFIADGAYIAVDAELADTA